MRNAWLLILLFSVTPMMGLVLGFCLGYVVGAQLRLIRHAIETMQFWIKEREAEDAEEEQSAVVESSPNLIRERDRQGELDTEESQIVTVKSPAQVRADKDRQLQKDIDRETGMDTRP